VAWRRLRLQLVSTGRRPKAESFRPKKSERKKVSENLFFLFRVENKVSFGRHVHPDLLAPDSGVGIPWQKDSADSMGPVWPWKTLTRCEAKPGPRKGHSWRWPRSNPSGTSPTSPFVAHGTRDRFYGTPFRLQKFSNKFWSYFNCLN
jgi:hypothetical protein